MPEVKLERGPFSEEEHMNLSYMLTHVADIGGRDRCNRLITGMAMERAALRKRVKELEAQLAGNEAGK